MQTIVSSPSSSVFLGSLRHPTPEQVARQLDIAVVHIPEHLSFFFEQKNINATVRVVSFYLLLPIPLERMCPSLVLEVTLTGEDGNPVVWEAACAYDGVFPCRITPGESPQDAVVKQVFLEANDTRITNKMRGDRRVIQDGIEDIMRKIGTVARRDDIQMVHGNNGPFFFPLSE